MGKEIVAQVWEAKRISYRVQPKKKHTKTYTKLTKIKRKIIKAAREKQEITYQGVLIRLTAELLAEILQARKK